VLQSAGYATYMTGKWHVTRFISPDGPKHNWPRQRGFDRFYGTIHGAGSYFDPFTLTLDNTMIPPDREDFYYTDAITDHAAGFIADHCAKQPGRPFFLYVAYTAPHWPMQAKPQDIAKYQGRYHEGWDALRRARHQRQIEMGLVDARWKLTPRDPDVPPWEKVENKPWFERRMEVYAAMVDCLDQGVGRIVAELRKTGVMDNTLIFFLADNGGCAEEYGSQGPVRPAPDPNRPLELMAKGELQTRMQPRVTRDGRPVRTGFGVMPGPADTYIAYGKPWANASNTPFRLYKHWVHEGGIAAPLVVHWPARIKRRGELERQPSHLIDIMATCVDVSGAKYPTQYKGHKIQPMEGRSLLPAFAGKTIQREAIYWEHEGNRAVRVGNWKLVARGARGPWELYDMKADRTELHDLAGEQPERVKQMAGLWQAWAERANVLPLNPRPPRKPADERGFSKRTTFTLKQGDSLSRQEAPHVTGRPLSVTATVKPAGPDGVIVAQGGSALGYSLYLRGGRLTLATTDYGRRTIVAAKEKLPEGEIRLRARLAKDGTVTLEAAGKVIAQGKTPRPIPAMPLDGLEVGRDEKGAVGDYEVPNTFPGTIRELEITLGKQ
jgi:arylsulfatase A-like enzyme